MTNNVYWLLETNIKEGETENLKNLMTEMIDYTKENEHGALYYEWSVSEDGKSCNLFERYSDSEATLKHLDSFGKNFAQRFMSILEIRKFVVYGNPDENVVNALNKIGAKIMKPLGGFNRK
ncbi:MAG: antibiotic biosynthesis monooxygenase [Bacteroidetes bacterium]|nr:antibiotic biosynthesis monooxygenase [Bacteroidota bacterium]